MLTIALLIFFNEYYRVKLKYNLMSLFERLIKLNLV